MALRLPAVSRRDLLGFCLFGTLLGFVQTNVTDANDPRWQAMTSIWRLDRSNIGDSLASVRAAERLSLGQPLYQEVSTKGASFVYPPLAALPYRSFVGLSEHGVAYWLFLANRLLLAAIYAVVLLLARPGERRWSTRLQSLLGWTALTLLWHPLMRAVELNQAALLVTLLIGLAMLAMSRHRLALAGILLALAIAMQPPLLLAVPLLGWHARRTVLFTLLAGLVLSAFSLLYAGWQAHVDYITNVLPNLTSSYASYPNQSWNGLVGRWLYPELSNGFTPTPQDGLLRSSTLALLLLTLGLFVYRIRALPKNDAQRTDVFGIAILAATLASPIAWEYAFAPMLFCLVWLWRRISKLDVLPPELTLLGLAAVLMGSYFEVRTLEHPLALTLASYVFAGAFLFTILWLRILGSASDAFVTWRTLLRRFCLPLPEAVKTRLEIVLLASCAFLSLCLVGHLLLFRYGRDQGIYAVVAHTMLDGGSPYRDAWDFKPPGIFFFYAAARALFGPSMHAIRVLEASGLLSLFVAFALLSRRFVDSWKPALFAAALASMAYVQFEFWNTAQPECFAAPVLIWAVYLATSERAVRSSKLNASTGGERLVWLCAGSLYGIAGILKPQLAGGVILTPWLIGMERGRTAALRDVRSQLRAGVAPFLFMALGASLPIAFVALFFFVHGSLPWLTDTLGHFVPHYSKLGYSSEGFASLLGRSIVESIFRFSRHNGFGFLLLAFLPVIGRRERMGIAHVLAATVFPILGVSLQAKFFVYHYGAILPLVSLLAGWGLWKLWTTMRITLVTALLFLLTAYALKDERSFENHRLSLWDRNWIRWRIVLGDKESRPELLDLLSNAGDVRAGDNRMAADWIAQNTPADSRLFVWGFEPVLYEQANRLAATRYIYNVPQRVAWSPEHRTILLTDLSLHPPGVVVIEHGDVFPWVTGNLEDSAQSLNRFPELAHFLLDGYRPGPRFGKLELLLRK